MPGKTISAYTDEETAKLVADLARLENRKPSQIAAEAIALYVRLPAKIHSSLRYVQGSGSPEAMNLMLREVSRAISNASYELAIEEMAPRMDEIYGDTLQTEEAIIAEAVRLTARDEPAPQRTTAPDRTRKVADTAQRPDRRKR